VGVLVDLKDSLGNLSRVKQLLIPRARHKYVVSSHKINILTINANILVKLLDIEFLLF